MPKKIVDFIKEKDMKIILKNTPICCVDLILYKDGKTLVAQRTIPPDKGAWWTIGGRLKKGETFKEAVERKAKEEIGIKVKIERFVGVYNFYLKEGARKDIKTHHAITVCFVVKMLDKTLKLNNDHSKFKWIKNPNKLKKNVKQMIIDSGVLNQ